MSEYGIYFGTEVINITEVKGKKPLINFSIPKAKFFSAASEKKSPDEEKIELSLKAASLKEEFTKNNIFPTNVNITLAGEDLIIRTFDLPIFLSKKELDTNTIAFEAKKYMPFKIADLVFDFRLLPDRKIGKMLILFVGIKKEILNMYLAVFKELQIQVRSIEYAGFSILRFLRLGGLKDKGVIGLLNVDLEEETNFLASQGGFPLFSRDITLSSKSEAEGKTIFMGKLKSEIRISLDFFRRKFPTKSLDRLIILSPPQLQSEIAAIAKDLNLSIVSLETSKILGNGFEFSPALAKSYATAISNKHKLRFSINLIKIATKKEMKFPLLQGIPIAITDIKISLRVAILAFLIIFLSVGWGRLRRLPRENELRVIKANLPKIEGVSEKDSLKALMGLEKEHNNIRNAMEYVVKNRYYFTEVMCVIPRLMPQGVWLTSFSFHGEQGKLELNLEGMVNLEDSDKEFAAINDIVLGLRNDSKFSQYFNEIVVSSMERAKIGQREREIEVAKFEIICR